MISRFVKPIRKRLTKSIRFEWKDNSLILHLPGRRIKVTRDNAIKLADWIMTNAR